MKKGDVLACASTAAFGASGRAGRVIAAELVARQMPMVLLGRSMRNVA